jgi:arginyl-tRNA synthetase
VANPQLLLTARLEPAFAAFAGRPIDPAVRRSQHSDFQADGALAAAKAAGSSPRELAASVVEAAQLTDVCSQVEVSGPGFINLTLEDEFLVALLRQMAGDPRLGVASTAEPQLVIVDYSAPNAAKEMHVGHLRSTIIGDAIVRLLEWRGHEVRRENHIGDWGTPFGMLVEHLLDLGATEGAHGLTVGSLSAFYQDARRKFDTDAAFRERSGRRVVLLQSGDQETLRLWRALIEQSERYAMSVYDLLDTRLTAEDFRGESTYNDDLLAVVDELTELGILDESEGALVAFPPGHVGRDGEPMPMIVRKRDGGFGYSATDLATIRDRLRHARAQRLLYVVGAPQRQHLEMVFDVAGQAGWIPAGVTMEHVAHGSVLGSDGKMLRTRAGTSVKLTDLLEEAVARASTTVASRNPHLSDSERAELAEIVGIGAVKYADLSTDRVRDYVFDLERMLAFEGNTGPYLQYACTRVGSLLDRAGVDSARLNPVFIVEHPAERALGLALLGFEHVIDEVSESLRLHKLANHLYDIAVKFSDFYERCPILRAEAGLRASRLALSALTRSVLVTGLDLLGIRAPARM